MCGFKRPCEAVQQSDQMYCDRCALVWDMNDDDPPECMPEQVTIVLPGAVREVEITATFSDDTPECKPYPAGNPVPAYKRQQATDPDEERQKIRDILAGENKP